MVLEVAALLLPQSCYPPGALTPPWRKPLERVAPDVASAAALLRACACGAASLPLACDPSAFSRLADTLLLTVTPDWLPCLPPLCGALVDALFAHAGAGCALEALAPRAGHPQGAVAAAAHRLLCSRFLAPEAHGVRQLARQHSAAAGGGTGAQAAEAQHSLSLLLSLHDRCASRTADAAAPPPPPQLAPSAAFNAALARAAAHAAMEEDGRACAATLPFSALLWGRLCVRGGADAVASVALDLIASRDIDGETGAPVAAQLLAALAVDQAASAEKVADAALRQLSAEGGTRRSRQLTALRTLLLPALRASPRLQRCVAERLLLRRPQPRRALALLLCFSLYDEAARAALPEMRHLALRALVDAWGSHAFMAAAPPRMHAYLSGAMVAVLRGPPPLGPRFAQLQLALPCLAAALLAAISQRLGAPVPQVRLGGMRVAAALAAALAADAAACGSAACGSAAPSLPQLFQEEAHAAPLAGDEWAGDLWAEEAEPEGGEGEGGAALQAVPPDDVAETGMSSPSAAHSAAAVPWDDDPDAAYVAQPCSLVPPRSESSYDSDDEASSSGSGSEGALSPFDMSDAEDVGGGPDAPLPLAPPPTTLRALVECLREGAPHGGGVASAGAASAPAVTEAALRAAESLVRAGPTELALFARPLALALLHAAEAEEEEGGGGGAGGTSEGPRRGSVRVRALAALLVQQPAETGAQLTSHLLTAQLDVGTRLEILDVLRLGAEELSGGAAPEPPPTPPPPLSTAKPAPPPVRRRGTTRIIAPVSLAQRARGRPLVSFNRFAPHADVFFAPLLQAAAAALGLVGHRAFQEHGEEEDPAAGLLLGRLLVTLGACTACLARTPAASTAPVALLALLAAHGGRAGHGRPPAAHGEAYVRRAAHYAASAALLSLPPPLAAAAAEEARSVLIQLIEAVRCVPSPRL